MLWLDITAAKARYGRWIDGCLPAFVPFPTTTRARTKQQKRDAAVDAAARAVSDADDDAFIRLSRLRCLTLSCQCITAGSVFKQWNQAAGKWLLGPHAMPMTMHASGWTV